MDKKPKLSTEPYKGVRDFYPEDMVIQNYIFDIWRKTAESFGYVEYGASPLESTELYKAKSGEEIVNEQTYSFNDRGDREVTLRPEMTPTVARMIAGKRREMKFPQRWFSIPNLFRYERPQRGRLREHFQLNCDMFGIAGIEAEVEMISLAYQIMKNFGINDDKFEIRINSRKLLQHKIESKLKNKEFYQKALKLIDKKSKIKNFDEEWALLSDQPYLIDEILNNSLEEIFISLKKKGIINAIYDGEIGRGFDYYTDTVFEIFDKNPLNNRSLFGGGRYDNLLEIFGEEPVPTIGFGMGDVTIRDVLETYNLLPDIKSKTKVAILPFTSVCFEDADNLAGILRAQNINTAVDYSDKKIGDKIAKADKEKISYIVVIGEEEVKTGTYKLKNLSTKEEQTFTKEKISTLHI